MNSTLMTYQFLPHSGLTGHFPSHQPLAHDGEFDEAELLRQARIRSGDYLSTLATELESIADSLAAVKSPEAHELERIVAELLYLERNYVVRPRR